MLDKSPLLDPGRDPASCNIDVSDIVVSKWRLDHGLFGDQKPSSEPQVAGGTAGSGDELWSGRLVRKAGQSAPHLSPRATAKCRERGQQPTLGASDICAKTSLGRLSWWSSG